VGRVAARVGPQYVLVEWMGSERDGWREWVFVGWW